MVKTVCMPITFDEDTWRYSPEQWLPEILELKKGVKTEDGKGVYVEFLFADILATMSFKFENGEAKPAQKIPADADMFVLVCDREPVDQTDTYAELIEHLHMEGEDADGTLVCWRHHKDAKTVRLDVAEKR